MRLLCAGPHPWRSQKHTTLWGTNILYGRKNQSMVIAWAEASGGRHPGRVWKLRTEGRPVVGWKSKQHSNLALLLVSRAFQVGLSIWANSTLLRLFTDFARIACSEFCIFKRQIDFKNCFPAIKNPLQPRYGIFHPWNARHLHSCRDPWLVFHFGIKLVKLRASIGHGRSVDAMKHRPLHRIVEESTILEQDLVIWAQS